jgi:hypothetical protein
VQAVATERGQDLAKEYGIPFFETSAKNNINVTEAFTTIASAIKKRLMDNPGPTPQPTKGGVDLNSGSGSKPGGCCKS